jgi:uncharacterized protein (TIGR00251 family)
MSMPSYVRETEGGVILRVQVQPRASRDEVAGAQGDAIKIRITSPPVEGAANTHLVALLAKKLGISRSRLELRTGSRSRLKSIAVHGISAAEVRKRLEEGIQLVSKK